MVVPTVIQVQVSTCQKGFVQETAADNQKFWISCSVQEMRGMEENLKGYKKTSCYDTIASANEQTNQQQFLRRLENSKNPTVAACLPTAPPKEKMKWRQKQCAFRKPPCQAPLKSLGKDKTSKNTE